MDGSLNLNLLPSQAKFQAAKIKYQKLANKISIIMITVWLVLGMGVVGWYFGSQWWLKSEKNKYNQAVTNMMSMKDEVIGSQLIKFRAKILGKVLNERFEYSEAFNLVNNLFGQEIEIKKLELKEKSMFTLSLAAEGKAEIDQIEKKIVEINKGEIDGVDKLDLKKIIYDRWLNLWVADMEVYIK